MPNGVLFLPSFYEAIADLPDTERLGAYDAVVRYGLYGELVEMSPVVKSLFALMRPVIDSSQKRYRAAKENGSKGGRPPKNQTENQSNNQIKNQTHNQEKEKDSDKDLEKETDSDSESKAEKEREGLEGEGSSTFSLPYKPLSEAAFERKREAALAKLEGRR